MVLHVCYLGYCSTVTSTVYAVILHHLTLQLLLFQPLATVSTFIYFSFSKVTFY